MTNWTRRSGLVKQTPPGLSPTVAGLLLIGREKRLRRLLPTNGAVFQVMSGTDVIVNDDIALPLLGTFEEMLLRFRARNGEREFAEGLVRVPRAGLFRRGRFAKRL